MSSKLGYGIGLRPKHFTAFLAEENLPIDWLEIVSENYMGAGGRCRHVLETLRARYPVATHGVGLSIAGTDPLDQLYLKQLRALIGWLEPTLVTDHLCWTSWQGHHSYDLLPFPLNDASLDHIASRIHVVQEYLGRSMLFENPSCYIDFTSSTYSEPEFLAALVRRTGCGILLDLNNCVVNSRNLGWDPLEYLDRLQPGTVGQFHLAGHSYEADISIDTHDHAVPEAVWQLFERAAKRFPTAAVLLEWDDKIPELDGMIAELSLARVRAEAAVEPRASAPERAAARAAIAQSDLRDEQQQFFRAILDPETGPDLLPLLKASPAGAKRGVQVYQNAYPARLSEVLKNTYPSLLYIIEDELFEALAEHYCTARSMPHFSINYMGAALPEFLRTVPSPFAFGAPQPAIAALASFDWAHYELFIRPDDERPPLDAQQLVSWDEEKWETASLQLSKACTLLASDWQIFDVWTAIQAEEIPAPPPEGRELCLFKRRDGHIAIEVLAAGDERLWQALREGTTLASLVAILAEDGMDEEAAVHASLKLVLQAAAEGLLTHAFVSPLATSLETLDL